MQYCLYFVCQSVYPKCIRLKVTILVVGAVIDWQFSLAAIGNGKHLDKSAGLLQEITSFFMTNYITSNNKFLRWRRRWSVAIIQ